MATLVLVPGAWLGRWVWECVTPELEGAGHTVCPVTLPGLADRVGELSPKVGLMSHVKDVVGLCERIDLMEGIIVGHSYAGAVVGGVARRVPRRLRAQVYLDTLPLDEGKALLDVFSPTGRSKFEDALVTWEGTRVWPMPERLGDQAPVEGLADDDLQLLRKRGTPHPALTFEEPLSGPYEAGRYPRTTPYPVTIMRHQLHPGKKNSWPGIRTGHTALSHLSLAHALEPSRAERPISSRLPGAS